MSDKQKQIEEMAKDIAVRMAMAKSVAGSMNNGVEGWLSEYLIERGWAKIPENAVVMTETERITMCVEQWDKGYNQARKNTAKKFAERAKEEAFCVFMGEPIIRASKIDEICKEKEKTNENTGKA